VLMHLVANARDAMPAGGVVQIRCAVTSLADTLVTAHTGRIPSGDYVTIAVQDDGIGMEPHVIEQLFEPFFTTKPMDRGIGLGLPMVFGTLKQHQAGITVDSTPGRGSTFTMYWPMHGRSAAIQAPEAVIARSRSAVRPGRPTVLVVDDEPFILSLTKKVLDRFGCDALTANSGPDAMEVIHAHLGTIDLLITDVRMPDMSGTELVDALLREGIDLPVLFVSGQLDIPMPRAWPTTMPRHFLAKPFKLETLRQELVALGVLAESARM
jgi:two-component system, cell cycle sensor histidine kinase and response regulator CckA